MKRSVSLCLLFCLGFGFHCVSQKGPFEDNEIKSRYLKGSYSNNETLTNITGSPYLDKTFQQGLLFFEGNNPLQALLRYNVVKEEIQVFLENDTYAVIQDKVDVRIGHRDFKKLNFKDKKGNLLVGYFIILTPNFEENRLVLLDKPSKKIREGQEAGAMRPATASQYIDKSEMYLKFPKSNYAIPYEPKTKKFLDQFPGDHQKELKKYMDENDLNPKKEHDLNKIIDFYNGNF